MKKILTEKLSNGLTILGEPNPNAQSSSIGFFVKTGARDETIRESGVSHFLEHMMFKGTKKRSAMDITYELGSLGAQANAYTSEEMTVFYGTILPENLSKMQELLSDMLRPSLTQEDFDTEKNVILEEIALYQDRPQFVLFEQGLGRFFDKHPAGNSVLGTTQSITDITRDEMLSYFERRYSPVNMSLVITGNFDFEKAVRDAELHCGSWKPFEAGRKAAPYKRTVPDNHIFSKKDLNQSHLLLVTNGIGAQDENRYALSTLSIIIGDGSGSKLYWELVEAGLCEACIFDSDERDGTGCMMIYAVTESDKLELVKEKILSISNNPLNFSDEDLERAKRKIATRVVLSGELPIGRLMSIGNDWAYREKVTPLAEIAEKILAITREDIKKAVDKSPLSGWSEYRLIAE
jgi:predicted Zn-dependent peptidase